VRGGKQRSYKSVHMRDTADHESEQRDQISVQKQRNGECVR
jgi:hypothetical protein